ncbi:hypothetical protein GcM1_234060 [Golovinomyces cichoracearum]|uniref:Uncharacterized protein n=1 Tax=Golovinomyces cichoracearum TaxID=62708 RepID=A0A420ILE1_9PEZI|nr:hypothetical protein GcM1_234060 [Golovinomyces cichoracearum]
MGPYNSPRTTQLCITPMPQESNSLISEIDQEVPQYKIDDSQESLIPPERPQSTPFPVQDVKIQNIQCSHRFFNSEVTSDVSTQKATKSKLATQSALLSNLPSEIHEYILDYLLGIRSSPLDVSSGGNSIFVRSWGKSIGSTLRHSRRFEVSQLALVSRRWRHLIQERLYRHLKIRGTRHYIKDAIDWFENHSHLKSYIRHIDIWFPVFQQKNITLDPTLHVLSKVSDRSYSNFSANNVGSSLTATYRLLSENSTLEEVLSFIQTTFSKIFILTLEGGERRKPPKVRYFQHSQNQRKLPILPTIRTFICKGQWNIIRSDSDFQSLASAFPNLKEWHASYARPKSKSYLSMATILLKLPQSLTNLNICLEADYRCEAFTPEYAKKVSRKIHFCIMMARAVPSLEHLAYTGRVCHDFFNKAALLSNPRESRLKTVDIVVKNICRSNLPGTGWGDGSNISDMKFITAFEKLVVSATGSLGRLTALESLRIRFIDIESKIPNLNPYFQFSKNQCTGIWSEEIVESLFKNRPAAFFAENPEMLGHLRSGYGSFPKARPKCISISEYADLANGIIAT